MSVIVRILVSLIITMALVITISLVSLVNPSQLKRDYKESVETISIQLAEIEKLELELSVYKDIDNRMDRLDKLMAELQVAIDRCGGGLEWITGIGYKEEGR